MPARLVATSHVPSLIRSKTRCPSSNPSCSSELSHPLRAPTLLLAPTSVMRIRLVLLVCSTASASRAACHRSPPSSMDARTPTPLDLCSSMLPVTLQRRPLPALSPPVATATLGTTAASTLQTTSTTPMAGLNPCQLPVMNPSFLLVLLPRHLETSLPGTTRGAPWTAVAPVLLILHLDTRPLLGLLVK